MNKPRNIRRKLLSIAILLLLSMPISAPLQTFAMAAATSFTPTPSSSVTLSAAPATSVCPDPGHCGLPDVNADSDHLKTILSVAFGIIGAFALLSMTASGLKYITSGGDPQKTSEAKKGIVFALVGVMIAVSAEAIVAFVVKQGSP